MSGILHMPKGHRIIKTIVAVASIGIILWLLAIRMASGQQSRTPTADWKAREDVGTLQYKMDTLLGPDGTGSQSGAIKMINDHIHNTDIEEQADHDFIDKLLGGLIGLGSLQAIALAKDLFTGKKGAP
jgi:hypothetical protein